MIATSAGHRVLKLIPLSLFIVGCSPTAREQPSKNSGAAYASQTDVPTPDYAVLQDRPQPTRAHGSIREASAAPPPDAREVGELWIKRLERRGALLGFGLATDAIGLNPHGRLMRAGRQFHGRRRRIDLVHDHHAGSDATLQRPRMSPDL